jgi:hypothetical protein
MTNKLSQPLLQIGRVDEGLFDCLLQQTPGASWDSRMGTSCETFQDCGISWREYAMDTVRKFFEGAVCRDQSTQH